METCFERYEREGGLRVLKFKPPSISIFRICRQTSLFRAHAAPHAAKETVVVMEVKTGHIKPHLQSK